MLRVRACGLSDVGMARSHNEDCFEIDPGKNLFLVADGMGGHNHGEVASRIAVKTIQEFVEKAFDADNTWAFLFDSRLSRHGNLLKIAIRLAHDQVLCAIRQDGSLYGMGTTIVGLLYDRDRAAVAHVGDSRAYRLRDGKLDLLTQDHTWVNEQVVAGFLSEEQARSHPFKNIVTRALGGENDIVVDIQEFKLAEGDLYLLCSDGLTTMLDDREIEERLKAGGPLEDACRALVRDANARGGLDNITVVLMAVENQG